MQTFLQRVMISGLLLVSVPAISGENDAESKVKYRQVTMQAMGKHMKLSSMIVKGDVDRSKDAVAHAMALQKAGKTMLALFAEGTGPDVTKTKAKAEVWSDRDGFEAAVKAYTDATTAYLEAAESGDLEAMKAKFGGVGKSCGGCHDSYEQDD